MKLVDLDKLLLKMLDEIQAIPYLLSLYSHPPKQTQGWRSLPPPHTEKNCRRSVLGCCSSSEAHASRHHEGQSSRHCHLERAPARKEGPSSPGSCGVECGQLRCEGGQLLHGRRQTHWRQGSERPGQGNPCHPCHPRLPCVARGTACM